MTEKKVFEKVFINHAVTDKEQEKLMKHIEEHKFFLNQDIPFEVTWDQAVFSWYDNIFRHVRNYYTHWATRFLFPGISVSEFYFQVMDHWHYMKKNDFRDELGEYYIEEAVIDYAKRYSKKKFLRNILWIFMKI
ncbi:MAG: hypothetical protein ACOC22_04060 [bacterium]